MRKEFTPFTPEDQVPKEVEDEFMIHGTVPKGFKTFPIDADGGRVITRDTENHINLAEKLVHLVRELVASHQNKDTT